MSEVAIPIGRGVFFFSLATQIVSLILGAAQAVSLSLFALDELGGATILALLMMSISIGRVAGSLCVRFMTARGGLFVLVVSDVVGAISAALITLLLLNGVGATLLFAPAFFLLGFASGLYAPALSMIVKDHVDSSRRPRFNGLVELGPQVFALAGSPLGVWVFDSGLLWQTGAANTVSYLLALLAGLRMIAQTRGSGLSVAVSQESPAPWRSILSIPWVAPVLLCSAGGTLFTQGLFSVGLPTGAIALGDERLLAVWLVCFGVGNLLGLRAGVALGTHFGSRLARVIILLELMQGILLVTFAIGGVVVASMALFGAGFANCAIIVYEVSYAQRFLNRRTFFAYRSLALFLAALAIPASQLVAGVVLESLGFRLGWTVFATAFILNVAVVAGLLIHRRHLIRDPAQSDPHSTVREERLLDPQS